MANAKGMTNFRNSACTGKQTFLPPKSPFPSISPVYIDYGNNPSIGSKGFPKPREGHRQHQRTSSESYLIEEQPSWLDDLLNEPETPVRRGAHRRSSSDSFTYLDVSNSACYIDNLAQEEPKHRSLTSSPSWGTQEFDHCKEMQNSSYHTEGNSIGRPQSRGWEFAVNAMTYPSSLPSTRDNKIVHQSPGASAAFREPDAATSSGTEKQVQEGSTPQDLNGSSERREGSYAKHSQSETDPKRVKQQFAQRSRVRKLQYIAELERNVQALQAEGSGVSSELEFLDQQNLMLNLENKALKQRLDSLAQEHLIKCLQQEMLEREIARLRALYQQQQQPPQQPPPPPRQHTSNHHHHHHGRSSSRDLDSQFANLSLKHKEANPGRDPATGPLRI